MPNLSGSGIYIGFDFGLRHIGLATGQKVTRTATPYGTLPAQNGKPDWKKLDAIIAEWQPIALIVGHPLNMDGTRQRVTKQAEHFANQLKERYHMPVYLMDERLTTLSARDTLFNRGGYKALKKQAIDALSAQIILESWLHEDPSSDPQK